MNLNSTEERWLPVVGYEGRYEVSDLGRVRRRGQRRVWDGDWHVMETPIVPKGYSVISLTDVNGARKTHYVHAVVARSFIGTIPDKHTVNHKNGVKNDNRLVNLEIVTHKENIKHSLEVLGIKRVRGERHGNAKLSDDQIEDIRWIAETGMLTHEEIGKIYRSARQTIQQIVSGKRRRLRAEDRDGDSR